MEQNIIPALLLTCFAGLSTGVGGVLAFFIKKDNLTALSVGLGFSAGVMIYISFMELLISAEKIFVVDLGKLSGQMLTIGFFFTGIIIAALVDKFLPESFNQDSFEFSKCEEKLKQSRLTRTGVFTALAIAIHNFPEGIATFMAGVNNIALGASIALAIAIHNIPEGIAVSLPIYQSTGSKKKAFNYSLLSGLAEPIGALLAVLLLKPYLNDFTLAISFATVAGVMIYISFDELLPSAREYSSGHSEMFGLFAGMLIMAISLVFL